MTKGDKCKARKTSLYFMLQEMVQVVLVYSSVICGRKGAELTEYVTVRGEKVKKARPIWGSFDEKIIATTWLESVNVLNVRNP